MKLSALKCTDQGWGNAGFSKVKDRISLSDVDILFEPGDGGLVAWGWEGIPEGVTSICGVPAFRYNKTSLPVKQPNGVLSVDHVVLHTNDLEFTKKEFERLGMQPKAERNDIYPGITQVFYRPGNGTVIEVVFNKSFTSVSLWGATLVVTDIDAAKAILAENSSNPKKAIQPGRQIMTIRGDKIGIKTNMAMMTPHVSKAKI